MLTHRQLFLLNVAQTSNSPRLLEIERAEGLHLYDVQGKTYMDLVSGFAVSNTGHKHPEIVQAIKDQVDLYMHLSVYGEYVQTPQVKLAEKITSLLPEQLNSVYFTNSGTEATEGAMKLAKRFTGRSEIIACKNSYHGSSQGALSLMGNEGFKQAYRPLLPGIKFINFNQQQDLEQITTETAAVIVETIQGEAGIRVPEVEYMLLLRHKCSQTGTLLILDEIQTGFGRTGKLYAFEHFGIVPDILLTAKAFGGGMPLGAFIAPKYLMDALKENPILGHITTFGGHPVCCAAGLASLEVILKEDLMRDVAEKESLFRELLQHKEIKEVRGKGLMLAIQLSSFNQVESVSKRCVENGVIVDWFLHCETALRIAPPLIITEEEIRKACAVILEAIEFYK
ncbi:aspartate aminotransferase family protein [Mucilaginibacter arboris]|uniref:Aminotransferase class III-fold pyridoxal phosphate-dependent enzyme n=1 Tax=Mucilaginibacter arboris TaxID=2682090 RepID=A0A7K1SUZ4_9SPHI|nr:aspartate aminotransferase family protein [Mucilaginibacter arboris]MVN20860.1 aminotransferase class III-fold pyridoxal phosphate-dependent enzyme [Mucilaginibacter arboris]